MAKQYIVRTICDVCGTAEDNLDAVGVIATVVITTGKVEYEVETCKVCYDDNPFIKVMRAVKKSKPVKNAPPAPIDTEAEVGYLPAKATSSYSGRPRTEACDIKGCEYMGPDLRSVNMHKAKVHGIPGKK